MLCYLDFSSFLGTKASGLGSKWHHHANGLLKQFTWVNLLLTYLHCINPAWSLSRLPGSRAGAVVRALAFEQCGPGSVSGFFAICGLSLLVLYSVLRGFSQVTPVFPSPQKPTFAGVAQLASARLSEQARGPQFDPRWLQRLFSLFSDPCSYSFKYLWNGALTEGGG